VINVLASDAISLLEGGLRKVTDAFHYAFIAYVSSSDVPMDAIYLYIGGKPVFHGTKGLSIAQRIDVSSLKQHFLTDIPLAKTCFDVDELRKGVIRLRNECIKAFESSALLSSLTRLALFLDGLSSKSVKLAELRTAVRSLDLSTSVDKLVAYLTMLFPAKVEVSCRGTDVYDYVVQNFEKLRQSVSQSDASKIFLATASELCTSIDDAVVELSSPLRLSRVTMGEEKRDEYRHLRG
jgi:hypothetical protein